MGEFLRTKRQHARYAGAASAVWFHPKQRVSRQSTRIVQRLRTAALRSTILRPISYLQWQLSITKCGNYQLSAKTELVYGRRQGGHYEEKHFRRLIEDVTELISGLVERFPASQALQQKLCETEAFTIGVNESLPVLGEIAAEQDKFLEAALAKVVGSARESHSIVFSGDNNAGFQLGHNSGSVSGFTFGKQERQLAFSSC